MTACDKCKDVSRRATQFKVALSRLTPTSARTIRAEVKAGTVELCDQCVDAVWAVLVKSLPGVIDQDNKETP